ESLLHSQLAFMEDAGERPDLFDVKYLRDELLFYSRDENQFLRRRRTFALVLYPDLVHARFKDAALPYQRVVLLLALLVVTVRTLGGRVRPAALTSTSRSRGSGKKHGRESPGEEEGPLRETILRDPIASGAVQLVETPPAAAVEQQCALRARRSLVHCLALST